MNVDSTFTLHFSVNYYVSWKFLMLDDIKGGLDDKFWNNFDIEITYIITREEKINELSEDKELVSI